MSLHFEILGLPGNDNALLVRIDSGQSLDRLLFDCGEGCLARLDFAEIMAIDHLFFSHFHLDHVAGFDSFFRCVFNREAKPNWIWGPPGSSGILQHRFMGFLWNLVKDDPGVWRVGDIYPDQVEISRFLTREGFAIRHDEGSRPLGGALVDDPDYTVEVRTLDHRTPSLGYLVREKPRLNVDVSRLAQMGLRPGPWLKTLKQATAAEGEVTIDGQVHSLAALRSALLIETPGESIAYLTDFRRDDPTRVMLIEWLAGCTTMVCESQYRHEDVELARENFHLTSVQAAEVAAWAKVGELVLFHLSSRYTPPEWAGLLRDAQAVFPATRFAQQWPVFS
jgi:ribonuclease Z